MMSWVQQSLSIYFYLLNTLKLGIGDSVKNDGKADARGLKY